MKDKEEIGKQISQKRKELNITQQELAKKLNVTDKAISNWETGKNYPDYCYFNELKEILGIDFNYDSSNNKEIIIKKGKILIIAITAFLLSLLIIYTINNYKQYNIYELNIDSKEILLNNSYLIQYQNNAIITINEIENKRILKQPVYNIQLYYLKNNKKQIISEIENYKGITIEINKEEITKIINNLYIEIKYNYLEEESIIDTKVNLKLKESNTHLLKQKEFKKNKEEKKINTLLINNGYKKYNENIFIKNNENETYLYNTKTNIMRYQYLNKEKEIIAEYQNFTTEQEILRYEVTKNNEIIEKYILDEAKNNLNHYNELYRILYKECSKINK